MELNAKRENLLNLALNATRRELEQSPELQTGYDPQTDLWEVIVRHNGNLDALREEEPEITIVELLNNYAVVTVPYSRMEAFTNRTEIEYVEKPKRLFFALDQGVRASCILPLQTNRIAAERLTGKGVICGIADSGIYWKHPDFCNPDGTTRILAIWDQTLQPDPERGWNPPAGYDRGVEFTREDINRALAAARGENVLMEDPGNLDNLIPENMDSSGHGTHVAGILAGNGRASGGRYRGVAYESDLVVVRLGIPQENGFPSTIELMMAVDYLIRRAQMWNQPVAVNLSFGNNYGSHSGTSLLETYLNSLSGYWKSVVVAGTGNEGTANIHTSGTVENGETYLTELSVGTYETSLSVQIWKSYSDDFSIQLIHPSGQSAGVIQQRLGPQRFRLEYTEILLYYGEPSPYSPYQEIYMELLPVYDYIDSGVWGIRLVPEKIVTGEFDMWLPGAGSLNYGTGFLYPTEQTTLTIPSTAEKVISVAAYDSRRNQPADFSGRGYTRATNQIKPDLAAPGVGIVSAAPGGGYTAKSGTSMAAPFVSGSTALLMQWGIVNGNDPYLYGEKVKAYLIKGAKQLPGIAEYPNGIIGYGTLCVSESLPR